MAGDVFYAKFFSFYYSLVLVIDRFYSICHFTKLLSVIGNFECYLSLLFFSLTVRTMFFILLTID